MGYQGNRRQNRKQTGGGVNKGEGGGGREGLSPCFLISIRENIFETLSSNGLLEEQKTFPLPIQILLVFVVS